MRRMPRPDATVDRPIEHARSAEPTRSIPHQAADSAAEASAMTAYPIQLSKIQCPTLRDETLARDRLLDWLAAKAHSRVLLILADAGYGKTTLLADFSRRTRLRTIWYRLDEDDRDWVAFLGHLVAAAREHNPEFGPVTSALLADQSDDGP